MLYTKFEVASFDGCRNAPLAQTPPMLVLNVVFWQASPKPKFCTKFEVASFDGCINK